MSELITSNPGGSFPAFGLEVISQGPVTLRSGPNAPPGRVEAIGSNLNDTIRPISASSTTPLTISGRDGNDIVTGTEGSDRILGEGGDDRILGGVGNDFISGGLGNDLLFGDVGDDEIFGDEGNDFITGGEGIDRLSGGAGDDEIFGDNGNDFINGDDGNDRLFGGAGDDVIFGGGGNDRLVGDSGNDTLIAGEGVDTLVGEEGLDTFVFGADSTPTGRGRRGADRIQDFNPREDKIILDRSLVAGSGLRRGNLKRRDFAVVDRITNDNREDITAKIIYERNSGVVSVNRGEGNISPLLRLGKNLPITASDFEIRTNADDLA